MANQTRIVPGKGRMTSLISASVLVTGLLLMAFVSGAGESSAASGSASAHGKPVVYAVH